MAKRHATCVEIAPDKEKKEWDCGVVFVAEGVDDGGGEIEAETNFGVRQPASRVAIGFFGPGCSHFSDRSCWVADCLVAGCWVAWLLGCWVAGFWLLVAGQCPAAKLRGPEVPKLSLAASGK